MNRSRPRLQYLPYLLSAGLLVATAFTASAQTPAPIGAATATSAAPAAEQRMGQPRDAGKFMAHMQERRAKHLAELKAKLKLDASQESAWTAFTAASQPPGRPPEARDPKAERTEFDQLTTPQRLDRMQARQSEHAAMFAKRADATRTFYAALTPEQRKTFDAQGMRHGGAGGRRGAWGHDGHDGHDGHGADGADGHDGGPQAHRPPPPPPAAK